MLLTETSEIKKVYSICTCPGINVLTEHIGGATRLLVASSAATLLVRAVVEQMWASDWCTSQEKLVSLDS